MNRVAGLFLAVGILSLLLSGCDSGRRQYDPSASVVEEFSGARAFRHVEALVDLGPRPSGSDALESSRDYLISQLSEWGWETVRQAFPAETPEGEMEFVNLRARFGEGRWDSEVSGLVAAHYDTKRYEGFRFVGANDGGSGVGVILELAQLLSSQPEIAEEIELVFFDGEEALGPNITSKDGLYGSRHYAKEMLITDERKRPHWGILLDMVGDTDLEIRAAIQIPNSGLRALAETREKSGYIVDIQSVEKSLQGMAKDLLKGAEELGIRSQVGVSPNYIVDDHIPLNVVAGIPTINLIDFDYPYWHTPADTIEKVSAESLEISGRIALHLIEKYSVDW